jgi:uridine phosphorylase
MPRIPETELILTPDNRIYHLHLKAEDVADNVIVVGDPDRVSRISARFSHIETKISSREFVTHTGSYNGKRITVLSTGIGTDNIDIVLNELDAAVNIDLQKREPMPQKRSLNIIRLGTSGALQEDIPVNALVASEYALGLDGLLPFYSGWKDIHEEKISRQFISHMAWSQDLPYPYCIKASDKLLNVFAKGCATGITATAPGFYAPQGRELRIKTNLPDINDLLGSFKWNNHRICNFEMETSALYGLSKLLGHHCLGICVVINNRVRKEFADDLTKSTELLIEHCLNKISLL